MTKEGMEKYCGRPIEEIEMLTKFMTDKEIIDEYKILFENYYRLVLLSKDYRYKPLRAISNKLAILDCAFQLRSGEHIALHSDIDIMQIINQNK